MTQENKIEELTKILNGFLTEVLPGGCWQTYTEPKQLAEEIVKNLGLLSVSERYLHINEVAMLIKNMPTGQAIQTIKAALSGQPETTVIDGELLVSYHNAL